jgi:RimJ/RimL family protein N-acetyltransferase
VTDPAGPTTGGVNAGGVWGPTLTTERLRLRQFEDRDLDPFARICSDPDVMRHIGDGHVFDRIETWRAIALMLGHWQLRGYGTWAVEERPSGDLVGRIGLHNPEGWPGLEVGWLLGRAHWGRGYATEGARAAVDYAWRELGAGHLISLIYPANRRSIQVAERLGARHVRDIELNGRVTRVYGLDRPDPAGAPSEGPGPDPDPPGAGG